MTADAKVRKCGMSKCGAGPETPEIRSNVSFEEKVGNHLDGALVKSPGEPPFTHHRADLFFQNPARKCEMLRHIKNILSHRGSKVAREVPFDRLFVQQLNQHT